MHRTAPHHWPVHVAGTCEHGAAEPAAVGSAFASLDRQWELQEPPGLASYSQRAPADGAKKRKRGEKTQFRDQAMQSTKVEFL